MRIELETEEKISQETLDDSKIDKNFLVRYNIAEQGTQSYLINGFQTIGWSDPYPEDDLFIKGSLDDGHNLVLPSKVEDLVYPKQRYVKEHSPFQIYIPRKEVMIKMMRACINVTEPEDVWIN